MLAFFEEADIRTDILVRREFENLAVVRPVGADNVSDQLEGTDPLLLHFENRNTDSNEVEIVSLGSARPVFFLLAQNDIQEH